MIRQFQKEDFSEDELKQHYELFRELIAVVDEGRRWSDNESVAWLLMIAANFITLRLATGKDEFLAKIALWFGIVILAVFFFRHFRILRKKAIALAPRVNELLAGRKDIGYIRGFTLYIYKPWQAIADNSRYTELYQRPGGIVRFVNPPKDIQVQLSSRTG